MCGIDQRRKIKDVSVGGEKKKKERKNLCNAAFGRSVSLTIESKLMTSTSAWREEKKKIQRRLLFEKPVPY